MTSPTYTSCLARTSSNLAMETALRCNSLKCRAQLTEQAVVTTCSHIFCINCSRVLGLPDSTSNYRVCPACDTRLGNPDDVVVTQLNPSEDYKTSVLSGLSPGIIIECAGRGLAFYAYQATQEMYAKSKQPTVPRHSWNEADQGSECTRSFLQRVFRSVMLL